MLLGCQIDLSNSAKHKSTLYCSYHYLETFIGNAPKGPDRALPEASSSDQKFLQDLDSIIGSLKSSPGRCSEDKRAAVLQPSPRQPSWYYLDQQKHVQGPFDTLQMRNWLNEGYFQIDLPVRLNSWSDFYPLGSIFSTPDVAFLPTLPIEPRKREQRPTSSGTSLPNPPLVSDKTNGIFADDSNTLTRPRGVSVVKTPHLDVAARSDFGACANIGVRTQQDFFNIKEPSHQQRQTELENLLTLEQEKLLALQPKIKVKR